MGRRRKPGGIWLILILFAGVYWTRQHFGLSETQSLSSELEKLSASAMPTLLWVMAIAFAWLILRTFQRRGKQKSDSSRQADS